MCGYEGESPGDSIAKTRRWPTSRSESESRNGSDDEVEEDEVTEQWKWIYL